MQLFMIWDNQQSFYASNFVSSFDNLTVLMILIELMYNNIIGTCSQLIYGVNYNIHVLWS